MFDNGSDPPKEKQSRGPAAGAQHLRNHTVSLRQAVRQPDEDPARLQPGQHGLNLPPASTTGNWLMGYGGLPNFTEYDASGHVLLDGTLGKNVQSFRTYLSAWSGHPASAPVAGDPVLARPGR